MIKTATVADFIKAAEYTDYMLGYLEDKGMDPVLTKCGFDESTTADDVLEYVKTASAQHALDVIYSYLGWSAVKEAAAIRSGILDVINSYTEGFITKCAEAGMDADGIEKLAQYAPHGGYAQYAYPAARAASGAVRQETGGNEEAPVMNSSGHYIHKALGNGIGGWAADLGSYAIPFVGDVRTLYDAGSDFANMTGKGLSGWQRLGYGLSGLANGALGLAGLGAGALTGGVGSTAVTAVGKPIMKGLKWLFGLSKLKNVAKAGKGALEATNAGRKVLEAGKGALETGKGLAQTAGKTLGTKMEGFNNFRNNVATQVKRIPGVERYSNWAHNNTGKNLLGTIGAFTAGGVMQGMGPQQGGQPQYAQQPPPQQAYRPPADNPWRQ